jgi:Na+-driven multidrug efflux pump
MIRAEGRLIFVTVVGIACDMSNILFDYILIQYAHLGMYAGGYSTLCA